MADSKADTAGRKIEPPETNVDHSPLPWTFTYFTKPDGSKIKTPQDVADTTAFSALRCEGTALWGVTLTEKDAEGRTGVICYTGNGPHSEANARLITAAVNALNITQPADHAAQSSPASPRLIHCCPKIEGAHLPVEGVCFQNESGGAKNKTVGSSGSGESSPEPRPHAPVWLRMLKDYWRCVMPKLYERAERE